MRHFLTKTITWTASVAAIGLLATSCATTGNWSADLPEKGSGKGGEALLMKR